MEEETSRAFGIGFEEISLASFIRDAAARDLVEDAERAWRDGEADQAMGALRLAFDRLRRDYRERKDRYPGRTLFTLRPTFNLPPRHEWPKLGLQGIMDWLEAFDERLALLSIGVDLRRYVFFIASTPRLSHTVAGTSVVPRSPNEVVEVDQQVYDLCRDFVIDTALQFAEVDYDQDGRAQRRVSQSTEA